jgi:ABC-type Fe3+-siderophore transport system permease subunit
MLLRGGIVGILAVVALAFAIAANFTEIVRWTDTVDSVDFHLRATPWHMCSRRVDGSAATTCYPASDFECPSLRHRYRAMEAFYVLTCAIILATLVFAVLDHGNVHKSACYVPVLLGCAISIVLSSLTAWAIAISIPREDFCDGDRRLSRIISHAKFAWQPSPFLLVVATVIGLFMWFVAWRTPVAATDHIVPRSYPATAR